MKSFGFHHKSNEENCLTLKMPAFLGQWHMRRRAASVTPLDAAPQCRLTMGLCQLVTPTGVQKDRMGEVCPLTLSMTFLLLRGELESESHPLCQPHILPTIQTHGETIICQHATSQASRAPPPFLGTGLIAAAKQGDGRAHTHGSSTHTRQEQRHHPSPL